VLLDDVGDHIHGADEPAGAAGDKRPIKGIPETFLDK
jgi:hypothetical protein